MVVTTQYNSRLGTTVSEISKNLKDVQNIQIFDKMKFPMFEPETEHHMTTDMPQCKSKKAMKLTSSLGIAVKLNELQWHFGHRAYVPIWCQYHIRRVKTIFQLAHVTSPWKQTNAATRLSIVNCKQLFNNLIPSTVESQGIKVTAVDPDIEPNTRKICRN
ncbi:hypothetical protein KXD40_002422 [Peronospora effusa]|nr:hypothetical protein KXD40_002422 [Peronospora effusa]